MSESTIGLSESKIKNIQAFIAGITFVALLIVIGVYLSDNASDTSGLEGTQLILAATFTGTSFGYYLGKASREEAIGQGSFFMSGILTSIVVAIIFESRISLPTLALVLSGLTMFLGYHSGLLREHTEFERWLKGIKWTSWGGLLLIGFLQFGFPLLWSLSNWLTKVINNTLIILSRMGQTRLVILLLVSVISIILLVSIWYSVSRLRK